jgi:hypothetical protein
MINVDYKHIFYLKHIINITDNKLEKKIYYLNHNKKLNVLICKHILFLNSTIIYI